MDYDYDEKSTKERRERCEAICAGERVKQSLVDARTELDKAKGWGIADMVTRGFTATLVKRNKMRAASASIEEAKNRLCDFNKELADLEAFADIDLSLNDFWGFADWFFDDIYSDWKMQNRINDARDQVDRAIKKVDSIIAELRAENNFGN